VATDGEITREPQMSWYRRFKEFHGLLGQENNSQIIKILLQNQLHPMEA
jgi:hypothetical protein